MEIIDVQTPLGIGDIDVMENLRKAKLERAQEKTRQELEIINERVKHIFEDYEFGEQMSAHAAASNIEFMADIAELQSILGDAVKKSKYQQKVTIFIVGFQDICLKRTVLLNQLSEFFETYGSPEEVEDGIQDSLEGINVEEINENIQTALDTMDSAVTRLNDLNQDIVGYMNTMHSALTSKSMKNRKKLEKNLALAKDDLLKVTEKLQIAQQELKSKEDQLQKSAKQLDNKAKELFNFKTQLDKSRKSMVEIEKELNHTRFTHEDDLRRARGLADTLEKELQELKNEEAMSYKTKIQEIVDASLAELVNIKQNFSTDEQEQNEFRKEIALQYRVQTKQIEYIQSEELSSIQHEYRKRLSQLLEIEVSEEDVHQWGKEEEVQDEEGQDQDDHDAAEEAKPESHPGTTPGSPIGDEELGTPATPRLSEKDSSPYSPHRLISSSVEVMKQPADLSDEDFWESVPENELPTRFAEFREEAMKQINELQSQATQASANEELSHRHRDEKKKWKEEKSTLLEHIQQLQKLQEEAEADADEAMRQLEEYASQQGETQPPEEVTEDAPRQVTSAEGNREGDLKSREQATSPEMPKPLSSVSKKSVVSLVEEKRAAMMRRKESANRLLTSSETKQGTSSAVAMDEEAFENFAKSYNVILQFKKHVGDILSHHPHSQSLSKSLANTSTHELEPDQNETDEMVYSVEKTLAAVESTLKNLVSSIPAKESVKTPATIQIPKHDDSSLENDELRMKLSHYESEIELLKAQFERRHQRDADMIQQLQNTLSNMKQDNIPNNMQITTNTPSATAPVPSEPLLTMSQGNRTQTFDPGMTMMFTRLDSEHNTKTLMKSTKSGKINQATLDSLVVTMEGYNEIAASRMRQLVQKIVHHTKMKEIEVNVRNSNLVTSEVFDILEKMEDLQRRRAQIWSKEMDELSSKRKRLGLVLQDAMMRLEKIAGVFLIKPLISYTGRPRIRKYSGKISTKFNKYQMEAMAAKEQSKRMLDSDYMKVRIRGPRFHNQPSPGIPWTAQSMQIGKDPDRNALTVSGLHRIEPPVMWSLDASLAQSAPVTKKEKWSPRPHDLSGTVPKVVELDVGRYLHEINPVHSFTTPGGLLKPNRVIPAPSRTYTSISRTGGTAGTDMSKLSSGRRSLTLEKPANTVKSESSGDDYQSTAPPTTPASQIQIRRGSSGVGVLTPSSEGGVSNLPRPLPPIQVPSRSRSSTRSSFTASPIKEYNTPSPAKSPIDNISPMERSKSDAYLANEEIIHTGNGDVAAMPAFIEIAN